MTAYEDRTGRQSLARHGMLGSGAPIGQRPLVDLQGRSGGTLPRVRCGMRESAKA